MTVRNATVSLPRSLPEEVGIASGSITRFLSTIAHMGLEMHSFMLLRHGKVAAEGWWNPYSPVLPHALYSISKSFTSTAIGFAVMEKLLAVDDQVVKFFPEDLPENVTPALEQMTIRHLLIMASGHTRETLDDMAVQPDGNWAKAFLETPLDKEPGTHFYYNTGATYMLSAILQKVSGQTLLDYLQPRLFAPLGILHPIWETCPRGINTGGFGLSVTTEDIAKLGQFYLQKGIWNGVRLLDETWIQTATAKQIENGDERDNDWHQGYGYQFWQCRHQAYRGDGAFGQFCLVMPEQDAVIAITSSINDMQSVLNLIWEHLLPAMEPGPLPANTGASDRLGAQLGSLVIQPPQGSPHSKYEQALNGKVYQLKSQRGWKSISAAFTDDEVSILWVHEENSYPIRAGRNRWLEGTSALVGEAELKVVCAFSWTAPNALQLVLRFIETALSITLTLEVNDQEDTITLKEAVNVSFDPAPHEHTMIGRL